MRLVKTLQDFIQYFNERPCCVSRELSKKFEENKRGFAEVHDHFNNKAVKGEIVIVVQDGIVSQACGGLIPATYFRQ